MLLWAGEEGFLTLPCTLPASLRHPRPQPGSEYTKSALEASAAQKESFFARKMQVGGVGRGDRGRGHGLDRVAWLVMGAGNTIAWNPTPHHTPLPEQENANKPEGLPPSQGGKYVGFGSTPNVPQRSAGGGGGVDDLTSMLSMGLTKLTHVSASALSVCHGGLSWVWQNCCMARVDGGVDGGPALMRQHTDRLLAFS